MIKLVPYLFALKNNKILTQVIYVLLQYFPNWTFFLQPHQIMTRPAILMSARNLKICYKKFVYSQNVCVYSRTFCVYSRNRRVFFAKVNRLLAKLTLLFAKLMRLSRRDIFFTYISQWLIFLNNSNAFSLVIMRYICCSLGWELYFSTFS